MGDSKEQMMHIRLTRELHKMIRICAAEKGVSIRKAVEEELAAAMLKRFRDRVKKG